MDRKTILFGEDFREVLPVVLMASKVEICKIWTFITTFHFTQNMRADTNGREFSEWILRLGYGTFPIERGGNIINIPSRYICKENSIVNHIFGNSLDGNNI